MQTAKSLKSIAHCFDYRLRAVIILVIYDYADVEAGHSHSEERQVLVHDFALYAFILEHAPYYMGLVYVRIFFQDFHINSLLWDCVDGSCSIRC